MSETLERPSPDPRGSVNPLSHCPVCLPGTRKIRWQAKLYLKTILPLHDAVERGPGQGSSALPVRKQPETRGPQGGERAHAGQKRNETGRTVEAFWETKPGGPGNGKLPSAHGDLFLVRFARGSPNFHACAVGKSHVKPWLRGRTCTLTLKTEGVESRPSRVQSVAAEGV